ncbi:MAG TPA: class I SAM-dependent methyltransferase [Rhabdaerophilum sp.]|nr:class I SAM-dependent methyltransferase [Rhabdaerophilum sp.]
MADKTDLSMMTRIYAKWAPVYDMLYGRLLRPGREAATREALACGRDILEVGVGTGLSLPGYPEGYRVVGIDLSKPMLERAAEKIERLGLGSVAGLVVMDACRLGFADASFDVVVGQYVITLVPDAEAALDEFARVCKPGGDIVLVNKIGAEKGFVALLERAAAPIARRIGLSSEFQLARIRNWADRAGFVLTSVRRVGVAGFYTVVRLTDRRSERAEAKAA